MKIGIIITSFNRPAYLQQCLQSVSAADLSQISTLLIVDDKSTDPITIKLINDFELEGVELIKAYSKENRSIKGSLLFGFDTLFNNCDVVINLDGDAIVRPDFVEVLMELHNTFPENILTGFNCTTKNKDGSVRHKILTQGVGYNTKASVGGINMVMSRDKYFEWVKPALEFCIKNGGNWDHKSCLNSEADGYPIVCSVPSVVQHIGIDSSMGHGAGGEPPDVASDFVMEEKKVILEGRLEWDTDIESGTPVFRNHKLQLKNVSLIAVDDNIDAIIKAADISCRNIEFGAVKLLSSQDSIDPRAIKINRLGSKEAYSRFLMSDIVDYIDTPYFITIQADGYILRAESWDDEWLNYDYIGSPWEWYTDGMNVGNGAASLRSTRLHQILKNDPNIFPTNDEFINECQEDHNIARIYRPYLEQHHQIKFAPLKVARKFGIEAWSVKPPGNKYDNQFCFHGKHVDFTNSNLKHKPY